MLNTRNGGKGPDKKNGLFFKKHLGYFSCYWSVFPKFILSVECSFFKIFCLHEGKKKSSRRFLLGDPAMLFPSFSTTVKLLQLNFYYSRSASEPVWTMAFFPSTCSTLWFWLLISVHILNSCELLKGNKEGLGIGGAVNWPYCLQRHNLNVFWKDFSFVLSPLKTSGKVVESGKKKKTNWFICWAKALTLCIFTKTIDAEIMLGSTN